MLDRQGSETGPGKMQGEGAGVIFFRFYFSLSKSALIDNS